MEIKISDHFTYRKLLRFVFPSIIMMIFTSIYGVVDGLFISNFVGKTPFAAVNIVLPVIMIFVTVGFLFGTGGSALVAQALGAKKDRRANEIFSMLTYVLIAVSLVMTVIAELTLPFFIRVLGASEAMKPYALLYGRVLTLGLMPYCLQNFYQALFVTAGKPRLGLCITVLAGVTNMVGDYLTMGVWHMGVQGAAAATALSACVGGVLPLLYFSRPNSSSLQLVKARPSRRVLAKTCANGSSEMMTNISSSIVNMLYNLQLMHYAGEDGVSAYGVIMYVNFIFISFFIGYSIGSAPIVSYHYGAGNNDELHNMFQKSLRLIAVFAVLMTASAVLLAPVLSKIFVGYDKTLWELTVRAFTIYSISFLIMGFNVYASSFFTSLGNGLISALISFMRTLVFQIINVFLLPALFGIDGIWWAVTAAELMTLCVSIFCLRKYKGKYGY
ncbi:MAG: MATE family efflux transporter [Lachnospiraceae bacterium]|jgi:putative MATE family efflux protein